MTKDEQWLLQEKYGGEKTAGFFSDCERLATGEPLAYVIGSVPFLDCTIQLDSHPLIPRPETEYWTEQAIKEAADFPPPVRILDLCAGSGAIGVAVAKTVPTAHVTFIELEASHQTTIERNCLTNDIPPDRYSIYIGDLFAALPAEAEAYDLILSNPPYIDPALDRTESSVKDFEPHVALYGGDEGLVLINKIICTAAAHLTPTGQLWLEHEPEQVTAIAAMASANGFTVATHDDQYHTARYSILTRPVSQ